jgi:hypothetical protein
MRAARVPSLNMARNVIKYSRNYVGEVTCYSQRLPILGAQLQLRLLAALRSLRFRVRVQCLTRIFFLG